MKLVVVANAIRLSLGALSKQLAVAVSALSTSTSVAALQLAVAIGRFILFIKLTDTAIVSEVRVVNFLKQRTDALAALESKKLKFTKSSQDGGGFGDGEQYFDEDYIVGAPLAQTYTEPSQVFKRVGKPIGDDAGTTDARAKFFAKILDHSVFSTDDLNGVSPGDDQTLAFFKSLDQGLLAAEDFVRKVTYHRDFDNTSTAIDAPKIATQKPLSDAANLTTAGSLRLQGYTVDMTYFAEDYVGQSQTF
jgi:hypothetical protein